MSFFIRHIAVLFVICLCMILLGGLVGQTDPYPPVMYVAKLSSIDELRLYDLRTGFYVPITQQDSIGLVDVAPNQDLLVTTHAQVGSTLALIDTTSFELVETVHGIDNNPVWSPSADRIAYRRYYYQGGLYIFKRGQWPPRPLDIRATAISWSPDGTVLAYARWNDNSNQEEVRIIDPITRQDRLLAGWRKPVRFMRWSPDDTQIALTTISGDVYLLDMATREFIPVDTESGQARSVQWTPDGQFMGVISTRQRQTTLRLYTSDGQFRETITLFGLESTSSFDWFP